MHRAGIAEIRRLPLSAGAEPPRSTVLGNLPPALTSFVGRKQELATIERLAAESRLVTVTGAGGIGKTRLAVEYAREAARSYRDGAWLVDLAPLTSQDLLAKVVSARLGLMDQPGRDGLDGLVAALAERDALLVLDNCEHLVGPCARLADALLTGCERLRILVTSRQVLGVMGETTWRLPSMATPTVTNHATCAALQGFESVELFVKRAETACVDFRLVDDNAETVTRICQHLDGIPLAIELAAARTRTLPLAIIDERLYERFAVLTSQTRNAIPRHRTLQATLDWSYDLLDDQEQQLFGRLAVFRGGFTVAAAEHLGADDGMDNSMVLDVLASLVDKSLVVLEDRAGRGARYRLLEPIRQYALEKLRDSGDLELIVARHARYYLRYGDAVRDALHEREQARWLMCVEDALDNFRQCFDWAVEHDPESALRLTIDLERYWFFARRGEVHDWLERSLAAASAPNALRAHALCIQSVRGSLRGAFAEARDLANQCRTLAQSIDSPLYQGKALMALAVAASLEHTDHVPGVFWSVFDQAEELIRSVGDQREIAHVLNNYGFALFLAGDTQVARRKLTEGLLLARELEDLLLTALLESGLADAEMAAGNREAAEAGWRRELDLAGALGSLAEAIDALSGLGRLALEDGDAQRSLTLVAAADQVLRQTGNRWLEPRVTDVIIKAHARADGVLGPRETQEAWERGTRMTLSEAVAYGLSAEAAPETAVLTETTSSQLSAAENGFICEGEYWALRFAGHVVRIRNSKGLQDIVRLVAAPGRHIAAVDLASTVASPRTSSERDVKGLTGFGVEGDADAALDAEARRQYRERLAELEAEVVDADSANDPVRATRARQEREFIVDELKAAVGLVGRDRRVLDPAERARKAVTGRIRDAVGRIDAVHPELGQHLRRSIRTGAFCVYDPPVPMTWSL